MTIKSLLAKISSLQDDADLLVCHDNWLEMERRNLSSQINQLVAELTRVQNAILIKQELGKQNLKACSKPVIKDGQQIGVITQLVKQ
jgi:hypothetical protein